MGRYPATWQGHFQVRKPASQWNAWFAVVLFEHGPFAWMKTHAFQPAQRAHGFPVASLRGFGESPDVAWMAGMKGIQRPEHWSAGAPLEFAAAGFRAGGSSWRWGADELVAEGEFLARPVKLQATRVGPRPMHWVNIPNFLCYRSLSADFELQWGDERWPGVGVLEHAWGGYLPVPAQQLLPGAWQWDLFWEPGAERRLYASLSARWLGLGFVPRAFADRAGDVRPVESAAIEVEVENDGIPTVWRGALSGSPYRAERTGKYLSPFPGGAHFGFEYALAGRRGLGFSERILSDTKRPVAARAVPAYSMR